MPCLHRVDLVTMLHVCHIAQAWQPEVLLAKLHSAICVKQLELPAGSPPANAICIF